MSEENKEKESWLERLQHTYRLVVMRDESFEEVGSYKMTRLNIYLIISTLVVITSILVILFIILTPMKQMIPGYGDVHLRGDVEDLARKVNELEHQHDANATYVSSVQRLMSGNFETESQVNASIDTTPPPPDSLLNLERIEEDEALRNAVDNNEALVITNTKDPITEENNHEYTPYHNKPLEQIYLVPPVKGEISNGFRPDKGHLGVDVLAPKNSPIKAVMDGIVIQSGWTIETGKVLAVQHPNNVVSFYKHNSALLKKIGDKVKSGEAIAIIGNTGTLSSGPHLHFELWYNGEVVDPAEYIPFN